VSYTRRRDIYQGTIEMYSFLSLLTVLYIDLQFIVFLGPIKTHEVFTCSTIFCDILLHLLTFILHTILIYEIQHILKVQR